MQAGCLSCSLTCKSFFKGPAKHLKLLLTNAASGPEQVGHEVHGGGDLGDHVRPAAVASAAPLPALDLAHLWLSSNDSVGEVPLRLRADDD